ATALYTSFFYTTCHHRYLHSFPHDALPIWKIAMRPAVELSYLPKEQQQALFDTMELEDCTPSHAQAIKMRKFAEAGKLNEDVIRSEEHTSELQSRFDLVCRLLLEKKKIKAQ